jgi:hypothetical protein
LRSRARLEEDLAMITDAEGKLARVTAALRVAVAALEHHGHSAPAADAAGALATLSGDDQANLENTDIYEVASIDASLRTWGASDGDSVRWLIDRVEASLLDRAATAGGDGSFPVPPARLEAARRFQVAGWRRCSDQFATGYAVGYEAERKRGDRLDRELAALRAEFAAAERRFDAPVSAPADFEAMGEALAMHGDSADVRCVEDLGLSVGELTVLLARSEAYGQALERRVSTDRGSRSGRVPPLDDATRLLLQELRRHVVGTLGAEQAARIMPMVGSYMAHAAAASVTVAAAVADDGLAEGRDMATARA